MLNKKSCGIVQINRIICMITQTNTLTPHQQNTIYYLHHTSKTLSKLKK